MRKVHPIMQAQEFKIKALLARRLGPDGKRLTMASLARHLGVPYPTVQATIYGVRPGTPRTKEVQARIAEFLGLPVAELFGSNGHGEEKAAEVHD